MYSVASQTSPVSEVAEVAEVADAAEGAEVAACEEAAGTSARQPSTPIAAKTETRFMGKPFLARTGCKRADGSIRLHVIREPHVNVRSWRNVATCVNKTAS